jgi:hypothetical protein
MEKFLNLGNVDRFPVSVGSIGLPLFNAFVRKLPMREALHHPIQVVRFGFELTDWEGGVGRDEYFLSGFCQDRDLDLTKRAGRDIVFEEVHQLEIFVGHVEDRSPDPFSR